jgi:hypothetical protein
LFGRSFARKALSRGLLSFVEPRANSAGRTHHGRKSAFVGVARDLAAAQPTDWANLGCIPPLRMFRCSPCGQPLHVSDECPMDARRTATRARLLSCYRFPVMALCQSSVPAGKCSIRRHAAAETRVMKGWRMKMEGCDAGSPADHSLPGCNACATAETGAATDDLAAAGGAGVDHPEPFLTAIPAA